MTRVYSADVRTKQYRDFLSLSATQFGLVGLQLIFAIFTTRLFAPEAFTSYAVSLALLGIVGIVSQFGLGNAAARIDPMRENDAAGLFWFSIKIGLTGTLLTLLLAAPWALLWSNDDARNLILFLAPTIFFSTPTSVLIGVSLKRESFQLISKTRVLGGVTALIVSLIVINFWKSILAIAIFPLLLSFLTFFLMCTANFKLIHKIPKRYALRHNLTFALFSLRTSIFRYSVGIIPTFLMAKYFSDSLLGNWNRGVTFIQVPVEQVTNSIKNIIYSKYAELSDDSESLHFNLTRLVGAFSIIIFPLTMSVIPFVPIVIETIFTNKWEYLILISQILLASTAIGVIYNLTESCLESANYQDICFRSALVAGTTTITLSFASFFSKNWLILALIPIVSPLIGHLCQLILWRHRQNGDLKILIRIYLKGFIFGILFFGLVTIAVSSKQILSAKSILGLISFCIVMILYLAQVKKISFTELLTVRNIVS